MESGAPLGHPNRTSPAADQVLRDRSPRPGPLPVLRTSGGLLRGGDRAPPGQPGQGTRAPALPRVPGPRLTPASAASDQLWLLPRISSTDQGRSQTASDAGARSRSGVVWFICSGKVGKRLRSGGAASPAAPPGPAQPSPARRPHHPAAEDSRAPEAKPQSRSGRNGAHVAQRHVIVCARDRRAAPRTGNAGARSEGFEELVSGWRFLASGWRLVTSLRRALPGLQGCRGSRGAAARRGGWRRCWL